MEEKNLSADVLRRFAEDVRFFFIGGWILSSTEGGGGAGHPAVQPEETLAQIVSVQLDDMSEIFYGNKYFIPWDDTSREHAAKTMTELTTCHEDTIERLRVDMRDQDSYMSLEAMDVSACMDASKFWTRLKFFDPDLAVDLG